MSTPLTAQRAKELLCYNTDTGVLTRRVSITPTTRIGDVAGYVSPKGYINLYVDGKRYLAHRVIWLMSYRHWPTKQIDHIDGDKRNNRLENLRDVDNTTNCQNKHIAQTSNTSGLLGVSWMTQANKWRAQIKTPAKVIYLGLFEDKYVAHEAYLCAKRILHLGGAT